MTTIHQLDFTEALKKEMGAISNNVSSVEYLLHKRESRFTRNATRLKKNLGGKKRPHRKFGYKRAKLNTWKLLLLISRLFSMGSRIAAELGSQNAASPLCKVKQGQTIQGNEMKLLSDREKRCFSRPERVEFVPHGVSS